MDYANRLVKENMITVCAYCKAFIKDDGVKDGKVSHGLCLICAKIENDKLDIKESNSGIKQFHKEIFNKKKKDTNHGKENATPNT